MHTLTSLLAALQQDELLVEVRNAQERRISSPPVSDSRVVRSGDVFVAIRGENFDGHLFIDKAVLNGAIAIICEVMPDDVSSGITLACVTNSRKAWALVHKTFHHNASDALRIVGVTGTNGKTTTTYLVHKLLQGMGVDAGMIGTIAAHAGTEVLPSTHTTPDPAVLHKLFGTMSSAGQSDCVMEISSHALHQHRVHGLHIAAAVFTNLTQDHLDYHGTMEAYRDAKKMLFDGLTTNAIAVFNRDDSEGHAVVRDTQAQKVSFGSEPSSDFYLEIIETSADRSTIQINGRKIVTRLLGDYNAWNALAAFATVVSLGYDEAEVARALTECPPVPGRFEQIVVGDGRVVIVDYAHTPDALEKILEATRPLVSPNGKLICVFGCGGNRDATKRPLMGSIGERLADICIVTADNPRFENQSEIARDIKVGFTNPDDHHWIRDRKEAIRRAEEISSDGDIVVVAGKGHETYQVVGDRHIEFDDREVVRQVFNVPHEKD